MQPVRATARDALLILTMVAWPARAQQADTAAHRNTFVAGTLSYFLPGLGSLYAGKPKHALVHSAIALGAAVSLLTVMGDQRCDPSCSTGKTVVGAGGLLAIGVNSVWSVVTAVRDAKEFNRNAHPSDTIKRRRAPYGIARAHIAWGGGVVPYLSDATGGRTFESRIGLAFNAFPQWTIAVASSAVTNQATTSYFARDCAGGRGCKPFVLATTTAFELQRRWWNDRWIHPLATVGAGSLMTSYRYARSLDGSDATRDSTQGRRFVSVGAGIEGNMGRWIHGAVVGGYRATAGRTIPAGTSSNSGPTLLWLVEFGRP